ncbi:MAG: hypothetical protein AAF499_12900, partial [Pseudomonadota bacterium]
MSAAHASPVWQARLSALDDDRVSVSLSNIGSSDAWVRTPGTVWDPDLPEHGFKLTAISEGIRSVQPLLYSGPIVKRQEPNAQDYLHVRPG